MAEEGAEEEGIWSVEGEGTESGAEPSDMGVMEISVGDDVSRLMVGSLEGAGTRQARMEADEMVSQRERVPMFRAWMKRLTFFN